jgi:hypothetical protein
MNLITKGSSPCLSPLVRLSTEPVLCDEILPFFLEISLKKKNCCAMPTRGSEKQSFKKSTFLPIAIGSHKCLKYSINLKRNVFLHTEGFFYISSFLRYIRLVHRYEHTFFQWFPKILSKELNSVA